MNYTEADLTGSAGCDATQLTEGSKFRATYDILYIKSGETISHTGSGSIQVRMEA